MNETRRFRDGQHRRMWQRIRAIRREAAGRGEYLTADFLELLELVASGTHIEKVTVNLKRILEQPQVDSVVLSLGDRH